jgi:hypothetical protein
MKKILDALNMLRYARSYIESEEYSDIVVANARRQAEAAKNKAEMLEYKRQQKEVKKRGS